MNVPCYKCEQRSAGCHSTCTKYITYRKELDEQNAKAREVREDMNDLVYLMNRVGCKYHLKKKSKKFA